MRMLTRYGTGALAGGLATHFGVGLLAGEGAVGAEAALAALANTTLFGIPMGLALMGAGAAVVGMGAQKMMERWMQK